MRILALILSAIAFVAIFRLAECEFYAFYQCMPSVLQPHSTGSDSGLIEVAIDFMVAVVSAPLALFLAFLHFRRNRSRTSSRFLLQWCWLLVLAFMVPLVKAYTHSSSDHITGGSSTPRDYTVGQSAICEVHNIQMQRTSVRVTYGLFGYNASAQARYEASKTAFPHAQTSFPGGCVVSSHSATNAFIYTCPECKKAASRWDSQHGHH